VIGAAAESWTVNETSTVFTFTLHEGMTFSNGDPVNAKAFAFAFARLADADAASPQQSLGAPILGWDDVASEDPDDEVGNDPIEGVRVVDELTLEIETETPFALLPALLTHPAFAPVPPSLFDRVEDLEVFAELPIGNGPYRLTQSWKHEELIALTRNDSFHGEPGATEHIEFVIFADLDTMYARYEEGSIHVADVPVGRVGAAQATADAAVQTFATAYLIFIGMPVGVAPYDDPNLRSALALSIDREAIATRVLEGTATPATGVVPPLLPGTEPTTCSACRLDEATAQSLLPTPPNTPMKLYTYAGSGTADAMRVIINDWNRILGIDVELVEEEPSVLDDMLFDGELDGMVDLGWTLDYPSAYAMLSSLFANEADNNFFGYASVGVDASLEAARRASTLEAAMQPLTDAERAVGADLPILPVVFSDVVLIHHQNVQDVFVNGLGVLLAERIRV